MTDLWDIALCSLAEVDWIISNGPDDWGNKHLWNVRILQRDYMALFLRRLSSLHLPLWEPETSHIFMH
jgi:hypothetical protein